MINIPENIFSALYKWGDRKEKKEDYYSKTLTYIFNQLINSKYKEYGVNILNSFFSYKVLLPISIAEYLKIENQKFISGPKRKKRPDIPINSKDINIIIEVKVDCPLNLSSIRRLKNYRDYLDKAKEKIKFLLLITRSGAEDAKKTSNEPHLWDKQISWHEIVQELDKFVKAQSNSNPGDNQMSPIVYLAKSFSEFLKGEIMNFYRVEKPIEESSLDSLINLLNTVSVALKKIPKLSFKNAKLEILESSEGEKRIDYIGYTWRRKNKKKCWCGIHKEEPSKICFEIMDSKSIVKKLFETYRQKMLNTRHKIHGPWCEEVESDCTIQIDLDLNSNNFFNKTEGEQLQLVWDFVAVAFNTWVKLKNLTRKKSKSRFIN